MNSPIDLSERVSLSLADSWIIKKARYKQPEVIHNGAVMGRHTRKSSLVPGLIDEFATSQYALSTSQQALIAINNDVTAS